MSIAAFRGSASTNTGRFENKTVKMMNKIQFPPELISKKINMEKIEPEPFKKWIAMKVESILEIDDDILTNLIFNLLQKEQFPDARYIYVQLVPFLERHVRKFMIELWDLLDSAQQSGTGIPQQMLDSLRAELASKRKEQKNISEKLEKRFGADQEVKREKPQRSERISERDDWQNRNRDYDRRGRDRDRDRGRDRDTYRERNRDRRRGRSRSRDRRRRDRERSNYRKRQISPSPPRPKSAALRKPESPKARQMPSPSPPYCLRNVKDETTRRSSSSSSSDDSSSSDS